MQVCVYCASSAKIHQTYFDATDRLAKELVQNGFSIVFGGGSSGLMGQLADSVLEAGGKIKGIMPQYERKAKFLEGTDALIALPGGTGTYEELFEAITLKKLGQFTKPIIILNTRNYFEPFINLMNQAIEENFMSADHQSLWTIVSGPEEVVPAILSTPNWDKGLKDAGKLR